ncbi:SOS response-associated peptidase family protein [Alicyclobacillus fastidiosus]|uniref:Abasic site processing protein n=1 Tax=Alicyclobacillus fastidiosus TaxID=392011 RepID=A0ABV5AIA8_9BACL|nr:SOS response-associated peptidase family protein [Alicyclobacillus fastidiosus]WEH11124.1 SOS response-associated peptidase family protein [Alicyclobacillus fastidiosus]
MPAILRDHQDERFWLDRSVTDLDELLTVIGPYPEDDMYWYKVDKMVGNVNNDSEKCVEEIK